MRKSLLFTAVLLLSLNGLYAQCTTCHDGMHYPDSTKAALDKLNKFKPKDGSGTLGQIYSQLNTCGLAYVSATTYTTTRYTSSPGSGFPATLTVAGLPTTCVTILKAYLFYGVSYTEGSAPTTTATLTNPSAVNGTYTATTAGTAPPVCWSEKGTASYCADVTPIITTNGNYTLTLNGFANADYEVDGVTMIIVYSSPQTWSGSIILWDGCMSNSSGAPMSYTGTGFSVCAGTSVADAFACMGDMQNNAGPDNVNTFNGSTVTFPNNFWNFNDIPTTLTAAQSSCVYNGYTNDGSSASDCWQWDMAGLYWQNTGCVACSASGLTITMSQTNPTCAGNNGTATATVTGGSSPYTYSWSDGQTTSSATGLSSGTYTVTVKDIACNTGTATVTLVPSNGARDSVVTQTNVTCFGGSNGSATIGVKGGTSPYTYSWSPSGGTAASASGLSAQTYTVTVTDNAGCITSVDVTITQAAAIRDSISKAVNVSCNGGNNGSAINGVKGGTSPYTYVWSNAQTSDTATTLTAGNYTVTTTDKNGCTATATVTITQPAAIKDSLAATNAKCFGGSSGSITDIVSGGTGPYSYTWNPAVGVGANANSLAAGTYSVTVTDANGCMSTTSVTITQPTAITATTTATAIPCDSTFGSASVTPAGGTGPYTYSWLPTGGNAATANNLVQGTYTVTITDKNGCTFQDTATVHNHNTTSVTVTNGTVCKGDSVILTASGSANYVWSNGVTGSSIKVAPDSTATYTVTANNGCPSKATSVVTVNTVTTTACCDTTIILGTSASISATNGAAYVWSPPNNLGCFTCAATTATPTVNTTYTVTVTGANGCTTTGTVTIDIECANFVVPNVFTPNGDGQNDVFQIDATTMTSYSIEIFDRWGVLIYQTNTPNAPWTGKNMSGEDAPDGVYYYIIKAMCGNNNYNHDGFVQIIR